MKRFAITFTAAAALAVAGCSSDDGGMKMNNPMAKADKSAGPAKADYFEVRKDGQTYVLGSEQSLKAFNAGQTPKTKPMSFDNGKTVQIESASYTDMNRLAGEYKKSKGL